LIVSPFTSQNTAQEASEQWHALQERLEAAAAAREAAEGLAVQLGRRCGALEAELGAAVAERDSALAVWGEALSSAKRCGGGAGMLGFRV
jgi:hypothetical protein